MIGGDIPFNRNVEDRPVRFSPGKVQERFSLRQQLRGLDRSRKHGIRSATRAVFDSAFGVHADDDNGDRTLFLILPEQRAELLTAHPGHIERDDDRVYVDRAMDLKYLVGCGRREDAHVRPVKKVFFFLRIVLMSFATIIFS
jgi:hypothetical protein